MKTTIIRLVILLVVLALVAGAWQTAYARGRDAGRAEVAALRTEFIQDRQGGGAAANGSGVVAARGAPNGQRPGVAGAIESIDGSTLTVATSEGSVTVHLTDQTQIRRQVAASPADLKAGDRVVVSGERKDTNEYTASVVQVQPDTSPAKGQP